mgnify:CR=1 FL=1
MRLNAGKAVEFELPDGWTTALVVLCGNVRVNGATAARDAQLVVLERAGNAVALEADTDAKLLVLAGQPLDEPIVGYGPFVMNSEPQITQAIKDYSSGRFGRIA